MFRVLLLIAALVAGGSAAWLVMITSRPAALVVTAKPIVPEVRQQILVAAADIVRGQILSKENLRWQDWPESALNPAFISRAAQPDALERLAGSIARTRIVKQEPIYGEKIGPSRAGILAGLLPSGSRAIGVRINAETTAGGFIVPGDRVDVLHTVAEAEGQKRHFARAILRNIAVLAIDQAMDGGGEDNKVRQATIGKTATLELTPTQAEVIAAAQAAGALSLSLRSTRDNGEVSTEEVTHRTIRVFRGGQLELVRIPSSPPPSSTNSGS